MSGIRDVLHAPLVPDVPEIPDILNVPDITDIPDVQYVSDVKKAQDFLGIQWAQWITDIMEVPTILEERVGPEGKKASDLQKN